MESPTKTPVEPVVHKASSLDPEQSVTYVVAVDVDGLGHTKLGTIALETVITVVVVASVYVVDDAVLTNEP
ncbi:hypothetical protein B9K06_26120, partial [Bacillus sp. OG2]